MLPVLALKPVDGDHEYDVAPLAVNVVLEPLQIVTLGTLMLGKGLTVTVAMAAFIQPSELVPVMV